MKSFYLPVFLLAAMFSGASKALDHSIGVEYGLASSSGDICQSFAGLEGCKDERDRLRLIYSMRFDAPYEFRVARAPVKVNFTERDTDQIFHDVDVYSELFDFTVARHWSINSWSSWQTRLGVARWDESFSFIGDENGWVPVLGVGAELGRSLLRVSISADIYPGVGDTDYVSFVGAGLRFVW